MNFEKNLGSSSKEDPKLPAGFTGQEQYSKMINTEAMRRIAAIEDKKGMSPEEAITYDTKKVKEIQQAIDATLMTINDPAKRNAFRQRMEYLKTAPEISNEIDRIKQEEGLQNRKDKKLPPLPPTRKPPKYK